MIKAVLWDKTRGSSHWVVESPIVAENKDMLLKNYTNICEVTIAISGGKRVPNDANGKYYRCNSIEGYVYYYIETIHVTAKRRRGVR